MKEDYTLHGWHLSYFSGKTRGYLNFKDVSFNDKNVNAFDLMIRIPKKTGAKVMPAIQTRQGEWLQDTTMIVEELERRHPESTVVPSTPKQLMASLLLEAWLDEWWIPIGMHYRWSYPENYDLFIHDASTGLLPYVPDFIRKPLAKYAADTLRSYLPLAGVREENFSAMESWTNKILDVFEIHFSQYPFLVGDKPSIADFALLGPLYGHLNRDPAPKRDLLDVRPNLQNWVERCHAGEGKQGSYLANDEIPTTLTPIFEAIFSEFYPMIEGVKDCVSEYVNKNNKKSGDILSRSVGLTRTTMDGHPFTRDALPYSLWMMQRVQTIFEGLTDADKQSINDWTAEFNQVGVMSKDFGPALERSNVVTRLA
jgi:glutathione S-transferase